MRPRARPASPFIMPRGELLSALAWREVRERAHVIARKLIGAGFARRRAAPDHRRHLAGLLRLLLRRPVCRAAAGAGVDPGRDRRQGRLSRPAPPPARRLGRGRGRRHRRSRGLPGRRRAGNSRRFACMAAWTSSRRCPRSRSTSGRSARPTSATSSSPRAARAIRTACRSPSGALMANLAGMTGPAGLDVVAGRSRGELAAALSRHGPDRLPDGAARQPALDRLSDAARLRAPADAVAEPHLAQSRHHLLQPELRLRPRRRDAAPRRCRPISTSRAGATPASAAT